MSIRRTRIGPPCIACLLAVLLCAPAALAQDEPKPFVEKGLIMLPDEKPWVAWLIGVLGAAACVGLAFKNPHRSHLD